jgi:hypothetical protein
MVKSKKVPTKLSWNEDQQKAMDQVIEKLTSPPIFAYTDYTLPFILHTDASNEGLGAEIIQRFDYLNVILNETSIIRRES